MIFTSMKVLSQQSMTTNECFCRDILRRTPQKATTRQSSFLSCSFWANWEAQDQMETMAWKKNNALKP